MHSFKNIFIERQGLDNIEKIVSVLVHTEFIMQPLHIWSNLFKKKGSKYTENISP